MSKAVNKDGGGGSISVNAPAGCPWSASSGADWIQVTSGSSGSGSGSVGYSVSEFKGKGERSGTVSVAGRTFTVTQKGDKGDKDVTAP